MDYKAWLGWISVIIGIIGYIPYIYWIIRGTVKPHAFSWLIWLIITVVAYAAQLANNAGAGAWNTGITVIGIGVIFVLAIFKGEKHIAKIDWVMLLLSLVSIIPWLLTSNALLSVILISLIDVFGFVPTFRKTFIQPNEESIFLFTLAGSKFALAILALENMSVVNWLYSLVVALLNLLLVIMMVLRRKQLAK